MDDVKYSERTQCSSENTPAERTYDTFVTETCYSPLPTRFDRLAYARMEEPTKQKVEKYDIIDRDGSAGERVDSGDVYFNKQTPTNANDNTTVSAVAAGFKNTPLTNKAPVLNTHCIVRTFAHSIRLCSPTPKMIKSSSTLERRYWFDRETRRYTIQ